MTNVDKNDGGNEGRSEGTRTQGTQEPHAEDGRLLRSWFSRIYQEQKGIWEIHTSRHTRASIDSWCRSQKSIGETMSVLSGHLIRDHNILTPFQYRTVGRDNLTYGMGPAGYDVRVEFDDEGELDEIVLLPNEFVLASTIERFTMPHDVLGVVHDKSTWIRKGLAVHNTVIEPGWEGFLTLELKNVNSDGTALHIVRGDPIAQIVFHKVIGQAMIYTGKYANQERGPQEAR